MRGTGSEEWRFGKVGKFVFSRDDKHHCYARQQWGKVVWPVPRAMAAKDRGTGRELEGRRNKHHMWRTGG
jgi:hypothetical protein